MEHGQSGCAPGEHGSVALYARDLRAAVGTRRADSEEVLDYWCRQSVDGGYRVVPIVLGGVPQSDAAVSCDHDVVAVLKEILHVVVWESSNQTTVAPRARVGVEGLESCCRALITHESDIHRAVVLEHHPVHLQVQSRRGRGEYPIGQVDRPQSAPGGSNPELVVIEQQRIDDILIGIVAELPADRAVG